jgi:hypothetical protein
MMAELDKPGSKAMENGDANGFLLPLKWFWER